MIDSPANSNSALHLEIHHVYATKVHLYLSEMLKSDETHYCSTNSQLSDSEFGPHKTGQFQPDVDQI